MLPAEDMICAVGDCGVDGSSRLCYHVHIDDAVREHEHDYKRHQWLELIAPSRVE